MRMASGPGPVSRTPATSAVAVLQRPAAGCAGLQARVSLLLALELEGLHDVAAGVVARGHLAAGVGAVPVGQDEVGRVGAGALGNTSKPPVTGVSVKALRASPARENPPKASRAPEEEKSSNQPTSSGE